ncbi:MAG TPA: hypothetical protein VER17_08990, partial [Tepidisphaeraceae bacterium]|nr:hypothetical protein [Tepidisphaeraceae bacterium]
MRLCIVSTWTGGRDATGSAVITAAAVMLGGTLLTTRPLPAAEPGSTTATSAAGPVTPVAAPAPVADAFERVGKLEDVLRVGLRDRKLDVALTLPKPAAERLAAGRPTPFRIGASDEDWLVEPAPQVQPQQPAGDAPAGLDPHQPQPAVGNAPPADAVNAAPAAAANAAPAAAANA